MKKIFLIFVAFISIHIGFAEEDRKPEFILDCSGNYYFLTQPGTTDGGFSQVKGPFGGFEFMAKARVQYTFDTPLGNFFLSQNATVTVGTEFECTGISFRQCADVRFIPFPFLVVEAGGSIGSGWNWFGFEGLGKYNAGTQKYEALSSFHNWYYDGWLRGTIQCDTGVFFPGDWTHFITTASYTFFYEGLTGMEKGDFWEYHMTKNKMNGLQYLASFMAGYQMPLTLRMVGLIFNMSGHFDGDDFGKYADSFDGGFVEMNFTPVIQLDFGKRDTLYLLTMIGSRRCFEKEYKAVEEEISLKKTGREWFCDRITFRWIHRF